MKLNNNTKQILNVARIELSTMFYSPIAWLVLVIFATLIGFDYANVLDGQLHSQSLGRGLWGVSESIYNNWMSGILNPILKNLYLYIPLVTMGLMSREYSSGTIKLLYSSPINNYAIILGKFVAMKVYGFALVMIIGVNVLFSAAVVENFQMSLLLVSMLGIYLLILAYSAIGLFMSSITPYQVVAAVGTLAALAVFNFIGDVGQSIDFVRDITYWLSMYGRSTPFIRGLLSSADLFYFLIVISLFIALSIFKLNSEKRVMSLNRKIVGYLTIVIIHIGIGYITSIPQVKMYYDATYAKSNTLSEESQAVIKKLDGAMTMTTYVNILGKSYIAGLPHNRNYDIERFEEYIRFKPEIKMKYVYYYHQAYNPSLDSKYPDMNDEERVKALCKISSLNPKIFKPFDELKKDKDLISAEGYQFIRVLEKEDGTREVLRLFDDRHEHPNEPEITATFKRLSEPAQMIAFSEGYGSRIIDRYESRSFSSIATNLWFRYSVVNQGFDSKSVDLDKDNLDDVDVLAISDLAKPLSDVAQKKVEEFIERGGSMIIFGEHNRGENMNKIVNKLGVKFYDGIVAQSGALSSPTSIRSVYTEEAAKLNHTFESMKSWGYGVSTPTVVAIDYSGAKDFEVTPIMKTSDSTWVDYNTTDIVDGEFICGDDRNEKLGSLVTSINMSREINGTTQRIIIVGDSDFIANEELSLSRPGSSVNNIQWLLGSLRWLSDDKYPISTKGPRNIDNKINVSGGWRTPIQLLFMLIIPLAIAVSGVMTIIKRQKK